ncbi:MAG: DegT/DnrJ/EryC1/StrS family aminotransferase [Roseobacter sp.]
MIPDMHSAEPIPASARSEIERLLHSGDLFRYTAKDAAPVSLLEQEFASMMGTKYALAVSSCSAALFLSLKALGLPDKARVLIPGFTFAAVPSAVVHANCTPVLCEVGDNYRIRLEDFKAKLADNISAVIISHMRGHTSDMDAIMTLCDAAGIPVIEDAAHSLGTLWRGQKIGAIGAIGCFSFQSYKMLNAGEGGIMITDDANVIAQAVIMSGAYEHNWAKHDVPAATFEKWQNQLPLYNLRLNNMSAALIRGQLDVLAQRVSDGRRNHDYVAKMISQSDHIRVPPPLDGEERAPDSIQFNLVDMTDAQVDTFVQLADQSGVKVQVFGKSTDNARAFWNWQFIQDLPELPHTRSMLMRACDVRLPVRLQKSELDAVIGVLMTSVASATSPDATRISA